jgi:hypothetical protein
MLVSKALSLTKARGAVQYMYENMYPPPHLYPKSWA